MANVNRESAPLTDEMIYTQNASGIHREGSAHDKAFKASAADYFAGPRYQADTKALKRILSSRKDESEFEGSGLEGLDFLDEVIRAFERWA